MNFCRAFYSLFSDSREKPGRGTRVLWCRGTLFGLLLLACSEYPGYGETVSGSDAGRTVFHTRDFQVGFEPASQTIQALCPVGDESFDFAPGDWVDKRRGNGFYQLGDITLRLRYSGESSWDHFSSAENHSSVRPLPSHDDSVLLCADLRPLLPSEFPLRMVRKWVQENGDLVLRFELKNESQRAVELGSLGFPMIFNNILTGRSLEEAHARCSFSDPYIGNDAGYLQVVRLDGKGSVLLVVPERGTPFEAYRPLLEDQTPRSIPFEGFYEWTALSRAYAEDEWRQADPWNPPTSRILEPGETVTYGLRFLVAGSLREIESRLIEAGQPVAVGVPGYVLPKDLEGRLFLHSPSEIKELSCEPANALEVLSRKAIAEGWVELTLRGKSWGRARLEVIYEDGRRQSIHYKVIKPMEQAVADLGRFITTEQWFDDPEDPFRRSPGIISYDYLKHEQVVEDPRVWIAGMGDEGGSGSWVAVMMKQLIAPNAGELGKLETFVEENLWGRLQYSEGPLKFGVRKSLFCYDPKAYPDYSYRKDLDYSTWTSWNLETAESVGRSYNYPHVAAAYWVLYQIARNHDGFNTRRSWEWYLDQACETSLAMWKYAAKYAQFGQMEGSIFLEILKSLKREGWQEKAEQLQAIMRERAEIWEELSYPFGSEMPWDSTGQEEVYAWCDYFGFSDKAEVTLNAILAYMPTVAHWGYNGSARRYWDFVFAGHPSTSRVERQLHHYGSGLNAIPVLSAYREHPSDFYLLRVGYGGFMGSIANITQEGFGPCGFHAYPSTLAIDGYSGDYGPNFFGHVMNAATYLVKHPVFSWLAFGGNVETEEDCVSVIPLDSGRCRVFLAPFDLWLHLDRGKFGQVLCKPSTGEVVLNILPSHEGNQSALLRIERGHPDSDRDEWFPENVARSESGAFVIPMDQRGGEIRLKRR